MSDSLNDVGLTAPGEEGRQVPDWSVPGSKVPGKESAGGLPDKADASEREEPWVALDEGLLSSLPKLTGPKKGRRLVKRKSTDLRVCSLTAEQRVLLLDAWQRSGLPAKDFAALVGMSGHTLYAWKRRFAEEGPAGLVYKPRGGPRGSRLSEVTKRSILMMKESHPEWGCERMSDMLARGPGLPASASAIAKFLHEQGYELEEGSSRRHPDKVRRFERARPNQLWQTDLFTFMLKRQNRRVHLVAFMDDHSRFIVGFGLWGSASTALVLETLRASIASYQAPEEILTDNGPQYITWRGKSRFTKELEKRGIHQVVAKPRRPQTLGKIERFWGTLWRECLEAAVFLDLEDARRRIGLFVDWYNFQRTHRGIDGMVPADRYFHAVPAVREAQRQRVDANSLELARNGVPKEPFYVTGQVGGKSFTVFAEGDRTIMIGEEGERKEVDLRSPEHAELAKAVVDAESTNDSPPSLPDPVCPMGAPERPADSSDTAEEQGSETEGGGLS